MTVINKYGLNEFSPEELSEIFIEKYAEAFDSTKGHANEMFLSEYGIGHDFHCYKNVEDAINNEMNLCGIL